MSTQDRRTRAQLIEELDRATAELDAARLRAAQRTEDKRSPEVRALTACAQALDPIKEPERSGFSSSYATKPNVKIAWVLEAMAARYGVDLAREVQLPCDKVHLETASAAQLADAYMHRSVNGAQF